MVPHVSLGEGQPGHLSNWLDSFMSKWSGAYQALLLGHTSLLG